MRDRDVKVGAVYAAKVSDRLVPVRVLDGPIRYVAGQRARWQAKNLRTSRILEVTAARLRFEVERRDDGRWYRKEVSR